MALVKCGECGHDVSTLAASCPNCGAPPTVTSGAVPARKVHAVEKPVALAARDRQGRPPGGIGGMPRAVTIALAVLALGVLAVSVYVAGRPEGPATIEPVRTPDSFAPPQSAAETKETPAPIAGGGDAPSDRMLAALPKEQPVVPAGIAEQPEAQRPPAPPEEPPVAAEEPAIVDAERDQDAKRPPAKPRKTTVQRPKTEKQLQEEEEARIAEKAALLRARLVRDPRWRYGSSEFKCQTLIAVEHFAKGESKKFTVGEYLRLGRSGQEFYEFLWSIFPEFAPDWR